VGWGGREDAGEGWGEEERREEERECVEGGVVGGTHHSGHGEELNRQ